MRGVAGQHLTGAWAAAPAPGDAVLERVATIGGPDAILRAISAMDDPPRYAITAEAAADRLAPFTRFARVELYVTDATPWDEALLTSVARGGNVILIRPTDGGALDGSFERDGVTLASRPQLYVDLVRRGGAGRRGGRLPARATGSSPVCCRMGARIGSPSVSRHRRRS